ncbi:MAG: thiamine pyrophosphate-binding protein, partial [Actinobacteria bacterium]|nr:thiamine pyrophosphate-binding protein [Actinomycetota bacterium]
MAATARGSGTAAGVLVSYLESIGVEVIFGIAGVHNLAIFDALRTSSIRTIVTRHEQSAAYGADGYARVTGKLGVCIVTTGPGVANTAAAIGEARASRSPVLEIATQIDSRALAGKSGRGSLHESPDQLALMGAVTVSASRARTASEIVPAIARAVRAAFSGRRGPVFVEIPYDLLEQQLPKAATSPRLPLPRKAPDDATITKAVSLLSRARRPVIWAGGGVIASGGSDALVQVAEALD